MRTQRTVCGNHKRNIEEPLGTFFTSFFSVSKELLISGFPSPVQLSDCVGVGGGFGFPRYLPTWRGGRDCLKSAVLSAQQPNCPLAAPSCTARSGLRVAAALSHLHTCPDAHLSPRSMLCNWGLLPRKTLGCVFHSLGGLSPAWRLPVEGTAGLGVLTHSW